MILARERGLIAVAMVSALLLTGCGKHYWNKTGAGADDFARDSGECARENALYLSGTTGIVQEDRYRACLKSRGWVRAQHREQPRDWFRGIEGDEVVKFAPR